MTTFRLDSISPELADAFRKATPSIRRKAALIASQIAASRAGLDADVVTTALQNLSRGKVDAGVRQGLENLVAQLDNQYFRLSEGQTAAESDALRLFSKARAASALVFASSEDPNG